MSNDLISRKETARLLRAYADEVGCNRGEIELANGILKAVCFLEDSENISTAYDLESVIEKLEKKILKIKEKLMNCFDEDYEVRLRMKMASYEEIKEILKSAANVTN